MLAVDTQHTPGHVGSIDIFRIPDGFDPQSLVELIRSRLAFVPRYRMRVRNVPGGLAAPVWVDDEDFDLNYHVRRAALPRPGSWQQLREFAGRVESRRLDRSRPLWECYLVEGLADNRFAVVSKTHPVLIDGVDAVDLAQVLLDTEPDPDEEDFGADWEPAAEPRPVDLVLSGLQEGLADSEALVRTAQRTVTGALGAMVAVGEAVGGVGGAFGDLASLALRRSRPRLDSPLAGPISQHRRVAMEVIELARLKELNALAPHRTINDLVLAVVTGALRLWLAARSEGVVQRPDLLALVPMSVTDESEEVLAPGTKVVGHLMALPIGEPNPKIRLDQVAFGTHAHTDRGRAVDARTLSDLAGFAPGTLHALGVRVGGDLVRRPHDLLITNVPGPQHTLYAGTAELVASFPVLPLEPGHQLAIGITSYAGRVCFGLVGDRTGVADLDLLAECLHSALAELEAALGSADAEQ